MILNYIKWDINPELVNLGGLSIRYYGMLFVGGLILSLWVLNKVFKREGIPAEKLEKLAVYGMIGIIAGARLGHCLFYEPAYYLQHPLEMLLPIKQMPEGGYKFIGYQGLASHGGALGVVLALVFYCRKMKEPFLRTIDHVAIVSPLAGTFIRLANLMNSEIVGKPTEVPWAFIFVQNDSIPRHPGQLYEAIAYIIIFYIVYKIYLSPKIKFQRGFLLGLSISLIFMARFFIEFVKETQVEFEEGMSLVMGQWLSIPFVLAGVSIMIWSVKYSKEPGKVFVKK